MCNGPIVMIPAGTPREMLSCLSTLTSEKARVEQENSALRAKVEAQEKELSQCRDAMASFYGIATETAAALRALQQEALEVHQGINRKQIQEGSWDERSFARRIDFLTKLQDIYIRTTKLQESTSLNTASDGTQKQEESFCPCKMPVETTEAWLCGRWMAGSPR